MIFRARKSRMLIFKTESFYSYVSHLFNLWILICSFTGRWDIDLVKLHFFGLLALQLYLAICPIFYYDSNERYRNAFAIAFECIKEKDEKLTIQNVKRIPTQVEIFKQIRRMRNVTWSLNALKVSLSHFLFVIINHKYSAYTKFKYQNYYQDGHFFYT